MCWLRVVGLVTWVDLLRILLGMLFNHRIRTVLWFNQAFMQGKGFNLTHVELLDIVSEYNKVLLNEPWASAD